MSVFHQEFSVHRLNAEGMRKALEIAEGFDALLSGLQTVCPSSREMSIARTKLEEACFFAKKAMASAPGNSEAP